MTSKIRDHASDIASEVKKLLLQRVQNMALTPPIKQILEQHSVPQLVAFGDFYRTQNLRHVISLTPNRGLTFKNPKNEMIEIQILYALSPQLQEAYPFGIVLPSLTNIDVVAKTVFESTLWPLVQERIEAAWEFQHEAVTAEHMVYEFLSACSGPAQLAKTWPMLYRTCISEDWFRIKAHHKTRPELIGTGVRHLTPAWLQATKSIDTWITASIMLPRIQHYTLSQRISIGAVSYPFK